MKTKMHYGASNRVFLNAKFLRRHLTDAEKPLWGKIRNNELGIISDRNTRLLINEGNRVIRFSNHQIFFELEDVLLTIKKE